MALRHDKQVTDAEVERADGAAARQRSPPGQPAIENEYEHEYEPQAVVGGCTVHRASCPILESLSGYGFFTLSPPPIVSLASRSFPLTVSGRNSTDPSA